MAERWSWEGHLPVFLMTTERLECLGCAKDLGTLGTAAEKEEWRAWVKHWVFELTEEQREFFRERSC